MVVLGGGPTGTTHSSSPEVDNVGPPGRLAIFAGFAKVFKVQDTAAVGCGGLGGLIIYAWLVGDSCIASRGGQRGGASRMNTSLQARHQRLYR